jgi:predicted PolB exonuclease-like 3'-5' exonuclease
MVIVNIQSDRDGEQFQIEKICCGGGDEHELISRFWAYFDKYRPRIVTWNGRTFDLPVLQHRAFIQAVPMPVWFKSGKRWESYRQRYSDDWHCDLMDLMACHGASVSAQMGMMASAIGLPGKIGAHGSEVQGMYEAGEIKRIRAYCECDVLNLYGLYIRWCHVTGRITRSSHDNALDDLSDYLSEGASQKPHFGEFLNKWDQDTLNPVPNAYG